MTASSEKVFDFVRNLVLDLTDTEEHVIVPGAKLEALALDSLDFVELQVQAKQKFGILIDPDSFVSGRVATVQQLVDLIVQGGDVSPPPSAEASTS